MIRFLLLASALLPYGQSKASHTPISPVAARALKYLRLEEARYKSHDCDKASNTAALNDCLQKDLVKSQANYVGFTRALGALLRQTDDEKPATAPQRIPFDDGEQAWITYREKACGAVFADSHGGTLGPVAENGCVLQLTFSHMRELRSLYSDYLQ